MLTLLLPWPPKELSPNARVHWARKSRVAKQYRHDCYWIAMVQTLPNEKDGRFRLILEFCPPDNRRRDDDNMLAAFKSGRDGIAQALGIDDSQFVTEISIGPAVRGGEVRVRLEAHG